jgi:hypothetical protein
MESEMGYDVIGDVHGEAGKLERLLEAMDYRREGGTYRHAQGCVAVFVGDLIDRGARQVEVLRIVRDMQAAGAAKVVMGNHELNAIGYATESNGGWLRRHSDKNAAQHRAFIEQVGWDSALHRELLAWFRTLPVALDLGGIRVCHAWWEETMIAEAAAASDACGRLDEDYLRASFDPCERAFPVLEAITKGCEVALPDGAAFTDPGGHPRREIRVRWWDAGPSTYRRSALVSQDESDRIPDLPLPVGLPPGNPSAVPVFVGHYWFTGTPQPQNRNTAVLDYSAAKDGPLVAYRWRGERELRDDGMVWSNA